MLFVTFRITSYHHHGNGEVGSELVVAPGTGSSKAVFVNASLMNQLGVQLVGVIWVLGHIEQLLKVLLDFSIPVFIGHRELCACT